MPDPALIMVALYDEDSSFGIRNRVRDVVEAELEAVQLGKCIGGWSKVSASPNYCIEFEVYDKGTAFALIRAELRGAGVAQSAELLIGRNKRYNVYDDTMTNLGPRPDVAPTNPAPEPPDMLEFLKQTMEEARRIYGGPKNPESGS